MYFKQVPCSKNILSLVAFGNEFDNVPIQPTKNSCSNLHLSLELPTVPILLQFIKKHIFVLSAEPCVTGCLRIPFVRHLPSNLSGTWLPRPYLFYKLFSLYISCLRALLRTPPCPNFSHFFSSPFPFPWGSHIIFTAISNVHMINCNVLSSPELCDGIKLDTTRKDIKRKLLFKYQKYIQNQNSRTRN